MGKKEELWTKWFHQSQRFASSHTNAIGAKRLSSTDETWCHLLSENALAVIEESSWWALQGHQSFKVKLHSGLKPLQMSLKGHAGQLQVKVWCSKTKTFINVFLEMLGWLVSPKVSSLKNFSNALYFVLMANSLQELSESSIDANVLSKSTLNLHAIVRHRLKWIAGG